jgi:hypothetical protein
VQRQGGTFQHNGKRGGGEKEKERERERESEREGGEGEERIVKKLGGLYEVFPNRKHEG